MRKVIICVASFLFATSFLFSAFSNFPSFEQGNYSINTDHSKDLRSVPQIAANISYSPTTFAEFDYVDAIYEEQWGRTTNFQFMKIPDGNYAIVEEGRVTNIVHALSVVYQFTNIAYDTIPIKMLCVQLANVPIDPLTIAVGNDPAVMTYIGVVEYTGQIWFDITPYLTGSNFYVRFSDTLEEPDGVWQVDSLGICLDFPPVDFVDAVDHVTFGDISNFAAIQSSTDDGNSAVLTEQGIPHTGGYALSVTCCFTMVNYGPYKDEKLVVRLSQASAAGLDISVGTTLSSMTTVATVTNTDPNYIDVHNFLTGPTFYVEITDRFEENNGGYYVDYLRLELSNPIAVQWNTPSQGTPCENTNYFDFSYTTTGTVQGTYLSIAGVDFAFTPVSLGGNSWSGSIFVPTGEIYVGTIQVTLRVYSDGGVSHARKWWYQFSNPTEKDFDGDGIPNSVESVMGLHCMDRDSDHDGTLDGAEDWDGDAMSNAIDCAMDFPKFSFDSAVGYFRSRSTVRWGDTGAYDFTMHSTQVAVIGDDVDETGHFSNLHGFHFSSTTIINPDSPDMTYHGGGGVVVGYGTYSIDVVTIQIRIKKGETYLDSADLFNLKTGALSTHGSDPQSQANDDLVENIQNIVDFGIGFIPIIGTYIWPPLTLLMDLTDQDDSLDSSEGSNYITWTFNRGINAYEEPLTGLSLYFGLTPLSFTSGFLDGQNIMLEISSTIKVLEKYTTGLAASYFDAYTLNFVDYVQLQKSVPGNDAPQITSPSDLSLFAGDTSHPISWTITDTIHSATRSYSVYLDGVKQTTGLFTSGMPISVSTSALSPGIHRYRITADDGYGSTASDDVIVWVTPTVTDPLSTVGGTTLATACTHQSISVSPYVINSATVTGPTNVAIGQWPTGTLNIADGALFTDPTATYYGIVASSPGTIITNDPSRPFIITAPLPAGYLPGATLILVTWNSIAGMWVEVDCTTIPDSNAGTVTFTISLIADVPPTSNDSPNKSFNDGQSGVTLEWTITDLAYIAPNAQWKVVLDGAIVNSGAFTQSGQQVSVTCTRKDPRSYTYYLYVDDGYTGFLLLDTTTVTVSDDDLTNPSISYRGHRHYYFLWWITATYAFLDLWDPANVASGTVYWSNGQQTAIIWDSANSVWYCSVSGDAYPIYVTVWDADNDRPNDALSASQGLPNIHY